MHCAQYFERASAGGRDEGVEILSSKLFLLGAPLLEVTTHNSTVTWRPSLVRDVHIDYCGVTLPGRPMNLDFGNGKCVEPYLMLQEALGHTRNNTSCNSISFDQFKSKGFTIFGFELSPVPQDTNLFDLVRPTNLSIRLNFNKPTPSGGIYCIVYAEFDQIIGLDYQRNPIIDTVV
ncbi:hypothetical protein CRE_13604 [Caenorhabditis remanei]|uniref:Uncharacterized protein n=1 Tax=Caenorhabditis remanei TaxID=31234 RepID=E3N1G7_CAERE|nr:hypothetical protein CRE_13604 [Caenorhabditis remanei]